MGVLDDPYFSQRMNDVGGRVPGDSTRRKERIIERLRREIAATIENEDELWVDVKSRLKAALAYDGRE